jgi:hypothetical protein
MSTERDAGLQALQQGNPAAAAPLLETACQQDPADFDALLFLGAAYGQLGRQMDAITTITRAVQLQPANAQARYNLAVAMEQGGYRDQAIQALGQALTLQPDYPKAKEALRRLQGGDPSGTPSAGAPSAQPAAAQQSNDAHGVPSPTSSDHGFGAPLNAEPPPQQDPASTPYGSAGQQPPASDAGLPQFGFGQAGGSGSGTVQLGAMPQTGEQPADGGPHWGAPPGTAGPAHQGSAQPLFGAPPPSGSYGQPQSANTAGSSVRRPDLAGNQIETPYGAPAHNQIGSPYGNPHGSPVNQGLYSQGAASIGGSMRNDSYVDNFDLAQAFKDWIRIITQPAAFFREMTGTTGYSAAFALLALYLVPTIVGAIINVGKTLIVGASTGGPAVGLGVLIGSIIGLGIGLIFAVPIVLAIMFFCSWVAHLIGLLFGNKSPLSATFRALVFASAPGAILVIPNILFSGTPISNLIGLATLIWGSVLLVMAISSEQEIATGPAVAVVVLTYVVLGVIGFVIGLIFVALFASLFSGALRGLH